MESTIEPAEQDIADNIPTICYLADDKGTHQRTSACYWQPVNVVNQQAWDEIQRQIVTSKQKVQAGRVSCLHYYMTANQMNTALLARYTKQSSLRVRLHLHPFFFNRLSRLQLQVYAELFHVTVDDLLHGALKPPVYQQ